MFNVGDTIWISRFDRCTEWVPCPVCFTKRKVTVILGDGTAIETPCNYCGNGFEESSGYVEKQTATPKAMSCVVTAVYEEVTAAGRKVEYRCDTWCVYEHKAFAAREEALAAAVTLATEQNAQEREYRAGLKEYSYKSYSWHVGYHKREAKEHRRQAEYHEARAVECTAHVKDKATNPASAG